MSMEHENVIQSADETGRALQMLLNELEKGRQSGETQGWLTLEDVESQFLEKANT